MPELIDAEPGTPEWLAARRQGVTATDIVSILGIGWKSAYWLYWNKLGQVPDEPDSDRFRLGRELEDYIETRWWEETKGDAGSGGLHRHSERQWQLATPDRCVYQPRENLAAVLELKSWADADRRSWTDGPPAAVRAQVLWQMDTMDVATGHVGVIFLPSGEFRSYVIEHLGGFDAELYAHGDWNELQACPACKDIDLMRERGAEFYARLRGELPPPDIDASAASLAAVKARFGEARKDKTVTVDEALWVDYCSALAQLGHWTDRKRHWENLIREQIGEAGAIEVDGQLVARRIRYEKTATWMVDHFRRVKQQGDDGE